LEDTDEMKRNNLVIPDQMNIKINDLQIKLNKYQEEQSKYEDYFLTSTKHIFFLLEHIPRSTVTDSIYGRKRSYTVSYTTVYMSYTLRIRPYFAGIHVIVLRSYITVTVYRDKRRSYTKLYDRKRSYFPRIRS
jgi:hypothetical protein